LATEPALLRPALVRHGDQWVARWLPVTDDGVDAANQRVDQAVE